MRSLTVAVCLTALLAVATGCGGEDPAPRKEERPPMAVEDTVFGDMIETQDRARAVEDVGFERKREMDQLIEETGGQ